MEAVEVRLLGQLEAVEGGAVLPVRGAKQRALLTILAIQRGQPVSADRLIDVLWGDGEAANPANALQAQIASCVAPLERRRSSPPRPAMPSVSARMTSMQPASSSW